MRPRRSTSVISTVTMPAPDIASVIQCCRCQSDATPSSAEYWHMGATAMRFGNSRSPMRIGEKRWAVMAASGGTARAPPYLAGTAAAASGNAAPSIVARAAPSVGWMISPAVPASPSRARARRTVRLPAACA